MISCTSPSASAYGLPTSLVTSSARACLLRSVNRPSDAITLPRTGAGTAAHPRCARVAAWQAAANVPASPISTSATVRSVCAGSREW